MFHLPLVVVSVYVPEVHVPYSSEEYPVLQVPVRGEDKYRYHQALNPWWDTRTTIVNVEHDMQCNDKLIADLLECRESNCTHAYKIYNPSVVNISTGKVTNLQGPKQPYFAQFSKHTPIQEGDEWADYSGIGLCKLGGTRDHILRATPWWQVEYEVNKSVPMWHVHWPIVEHYHP